MMLRQCLFAAFPLLASCGQGEMTDTPKQGTKITVRSQNQQQLHDFDDLNRAIALKRAIRDSGSSCLRVTKSGFIGPYQNMEYWTATCEDEHDRTRDWALFIGADDSVQVRLCEDVAKVGLPECRLPEVDKGVAASGTEKVG